MKAGQYQTILPSWFRAVVASWAVTTDGYQRMQHASSEYIYTKYPNLGTSDHEGGTPRFWDVKYTDDVNTGLGVINEVDVRVSLVDHLVNARTDDKIIIFAPAVSIDQTELVFWGHRWSPKLSKQNDSNFWTTNYPDAVLYATMFHVDSRNRDMSSAKDFLALAENEVRDYIRSRTMDEVRDVPMQMRG